MDPETPPKKILVVEGTDDMHVVKHLWSHYDPKFQPFEIATRGGFNGIIKSLRPDLKARGREVLGILADSNDNPTDRWKSIAHSIEQWKRTAYPSERTTRIRIPENTRQNGIIFEDTNPRIGIWLMPDNTSPGELEDFIARLVPEGDAIWPRANQYIDEIPGIDREFKDRKESKAKVHAWLATRKEPHRMGTAITTGDLDLDTPIAKVFYRWLRQLFAETA